MFKICLLIGLLFSAAASAQTVYVNDDFEDGLSNDDTNTLDLAWTKAPGQDKLNLGTAVYNSGASNSSTNASTAMYVDNTRTVDGQFINVHGKLFNNVSPVALAVGETLTLKMDFRVPVASIGNLGAAFRLGLGTSNANYSVNFGSGTSASGSVQRYNADLASGSSTNITTSTTTVAINDNESHQFTLEITRTDTNVMSLKGTIDDVVITGLLNSTSDFTFNRAFIGQGSALNLDMHVDNVQVFTAIPEPGSMGVLLAGAALVLRRRRVQG